MNLRRMCRASFFLSLLPSTWFVLLFCCGAMSLSALLSSKDERDKLIVARTPKKTVQATDFWSRSFQKYALESKNVPDLLALSKEKIGEVLECYFVDVRTKGGDMYCCNSYVSAKAAIQRWLSASMTINIFTDPEFKRANAVLDGLLKEKKRQGLEAPVKHKDAISDADWKKIELHFADVLTANDPRKLCQFVWFHVTSKFCLRGGEIQRLLCKDDLVRSVVDSKPVYNLAKAFMSKNHQGGLIGSNHLSVGCIQDPIQVEALDLYLSKLHPSLDRFFSTSKGSPRNYAQWFSFSFSLVRQFSHFS